MNLAASAGGGGFHDDGTIVGRLVGDANLVHVLF